MNELPPLVHFSSGAALLPVLLVFLASRASHVAWGFFWRFLRG